MSRANGLMDHAESGRQGGLKHSQKHMRALRARSSTRGRLPLRSYDVIVREPSGASRARAIARVQGVDAASIDL